jgi:5-oxoprolinase (ATP-hydrolysing)
VSGGAFDPVGLEILWSRLVNITEECWVTIGRTAFSMVIGESQDFGCELLDSAGNSIAHSPRSTPAFNLALPRTLAALLEVYPPETLRDGDVLITNDPWICAGHLSDVALVTPIFKGGRLIAYVASIAHWSDIGGTLDSTAAREIYEEGLQIPPLKAWIAGTPNETLRSLIRQNVRNPDMVLGDLQAQFIANDVGRRRLIDFVNEYGMKDLTELSATIQGRAEKAMREAIARLPNGTYTYALQLDAAGQPVELPIKIVIVDDELVVDYVGAPSQVSRGAINCPLSFTTAHTVYALKCALTPGIRSNAGCFRPIKVMAPVGTIVNCTHPSAVNLRTLVGWFCAPAVFGAMAEILPHDVQGFTGKPIALTTYGENPDKSRFNDYLLYGGGQGASADHDGRSTLIFPPSAANTSIELLESRSGLIVDCKRLIPDSGGAGRRRGGLGQLIRLRKLSADGHPVQVSIQPADNHIDVPPLHGGCAGTPYGVILEGEGSDPRRDLGGLVELFEPGQALVFELGGGSGFGPPLMRPIAEIQSDLDQGFVTEAGLRNYGCDVDPTSGLVRRRLDLSNR